MRVYIPAVMADLAECTSGKWRPPMGYAATPLMLDALGDVDPEELDEQLRDAAAYDSVVELKSDRRVVIVADVARSEAQPIDGGHPADVSLTSVIPADAIACAFVDEPAAIMDGEPAAAGDKAALGRLEALDLLWFGPTELAYVE